VIPDSEAFDWAALRARAEAFDPRGVDNKALYQAFGESFDGFDDDGEGSYNTLGEDPSDWLEYDGHPAQQPNADAIRAILSKDVDLIRERATNPGPYIRESDNYHTFGYGFSVIVVAGNIVLTGSSNEYCLAAGEVDDMSEIEQVVFNRFLQLGLLSAPQ
jgi:hypothetical protein